VTEPADLELAGLLSVVREALAEADPLAAALLGGPLALPDPAEAAEAAALARLSELAGDLDHLGVRAGEDDELDRLAVMYGLRRAVASARPDDPAGPPVLERHLQLRLLRLLDHPADGLQSLTELVEAGPRLLLQARRDPGRGSAVAGQLALESARRMPALLEAGAGAARQAEGGVRARAEAGLGALLQAAAEESGWLLKEYLPAAPGVPRPGSLDPEWAGLGISLAELEAEAEAALAASVTEFADRPTRENGSAEAEPAGLEEVQRAWEVAAEAAATRWAARPGDGAVVLEAPAWLAPLMPPISLWQPGPRSPTPLHVLVANPRRADLSSLAGEVYEADFLPAAFQRAEVRVARLLLPAPELQQGWRAHVRANGAGPANWSTEMAWRAALALAALAMSRGQATVDDAAGLIAAEAGLPGDQALLQAMTVALRPLPALSFLAGRVAVTRALASGTPARLLAAGPLPGAAIANRV